MSNCDFTLPPRRRIYPVISLLPILLLVSACLEPDGQEDRIIIDNDTGSLIGRVRYLSEPVLLDSLAAIGKSLKKDLDEKLTLVAEVSPPVYDGLTLQATDVVIKGVKAYVTYNMQGDRFLGGVDIFDVSDTYSPELISSAIFADTDVNGVAIQGNTLYLAAATDREGFESPAVLEVVTLKGGLLTDDYTTIDLPSWAGTDVVEANERIYVTSGADSGAVTVLTVATLAVERTLAVDDARGVSADDRDIGVVAGTPARLITFDRNTGEVIFDYELVGATIPYSKSTIEINRRKAVLALGDGGTQIVCLATGELIEQIMQPEVDGLSLDVTVTNAASTYKKTLFMANGEAGVYVASAATKFDSKDCEIDDLKLVGRLRFDDLQSVNHVAYKSDILFIASGLGGLKIVSVDDDN